jgi:quinol monooxygenase YgiN
VLGALPQPRPVRPTGQAAEEADKLRRAAETDTQVSWLVELAVKPGALERFRALTGEMVESARREPGALVFERFISEDGTAVQVYERYADSVAALVHLQGFEEMFAARFTSMVNRTRFTVLGTPSDEVREILNKFGATYLGPFDGFARYDAG